MRVVARALADGRLSLDPGVDRHDAIEDLVALRGIGPWTASYVAMRALGDPDSFLATDLGVRRGLERVGLRGDPKSAVEVAERWRPWRSYAVQYLWSGSGDEAGKTKQQPKRGGRR